MVMSGHGRSMGDLSGECDGCQRVSARKKTLQIVIDGIVYFSCTDADKTLLLSILCRDSKRDIVQSETIKFSWD